MRDGSVRGGRLLPCQSERCPKHNLRTFRAEMGAEGTSGAPATPRPSSAPPRSGSAAAPAAGGGTGASPHLRRNGHARPKLIKPASPPGSEEETPPSIYTNRPPPGEQAEEARGSQPAPNPGRQDGAAAFPAPPGASRPRVPSPPTPSRSAAARRLGPLPAGVLRAGGPAGRVGAAPLEAAGLDFLRIAARLKCAPSAPLILGAGGGGRDRVREKPRGPGRPSSTRGRHSPEGSAALPRRSRPLTCPPLPAPSLPRQHLARPPPPAAPTGPDRTGPDRSGAATSPLRTPAAQVPPPALGGRRTCSASSRPVLSRPGPGSGPEGAWARG